MAKTEAPTIKQLIAVRRRKSSIVIVQNVVEFEI
jgi:hypothetical protein